MNQPLTGPADLAGRVTPRPVVVALVVTFNRLAQLQVTLARLLSEDLDAVVVVDNASTDGTAAYLAGQANSRLRVIRLDRNGGGAGGFEQGLAAVMARYDPDWCVLMDDDARPEPGAIAQFRTTEADPHQWEALAAGVFYPGGAICEMNRPSRNPFWHARQFLRTLFGGGRSGFHVSDGDYQARTVQPIDASSFVGFFVSRAAIARVGYPDGKLFIYGDDVLYTLKLSRAGGAIGFAPWLRFEHDCTTLRPGEGHIHRPLWKAYYNYRNGLLAYRTAAGPVLFWPVLAIVAVKWRMKASAYGPDRAIYLRLLGLAVRDALTGRLGRSHDDVLALAASRTPAAAAPGAADGAG